MDKGSIGGVFLAIAGIVAGLLIEGGNLGQILQPTAALIVFGGTMGAVLLQFPLPTVLAAFGSLAHVFSAPRKHNDQLLHQLVAFANKARRNGVVSLDSDLETIQDPFLKQALMLAVDGTEPTELRKIMRVSLDCTAENEERLPAVFESAGGFSPTIGILGAVLGLIQVMKNLDNIQEVGKGIAVAFVATIYGVGIANLFFLPFAGKMRIRMRDDHQRREMMLEGVISILEGMNPRMLEVKLAGFLNDPSAKAEGARRMMKERRKSNVSRDRWLVSYADFITLLFAFFVVLYAFAKADQKKQVQVSEAIDSAFRSLGIFPDASGKPAEGSAAGAEQAAIPMNIVMGEDVLSPARVKDDLNNIRRELEQKLSNQVASHAVSIQMGRDGLVISLREAGFFSSGSATPKPETLPTLRQIAAIAGPHALRSAHRGPHRQRPHPHRGIRLQLGALLGPRHAHRPPLSRSEGHISRAHLGRRLRRVPPRGRQRHRRWPRRKPPRRSGRPAPHQDQSLRA